jgi:hypothetical protein
MQSIVIGSEKILLEAIWIWKSVRRHGLTVTGALDVICCIGCGPPLVLRMYGKMYSLRTLLKLKLNILLTCCPGPTLSMVSVQKSKYRTTFVGCLDKICRRKLGLNLMVGTYIRQRAPEIAPCQCPMRAETVHLMLPVPPGGRTWRPVELE